MHLGDLLCIDWDESEQRLVFEKEGEGAVLPIAAPAAAAAAGAQAARATGGKPAETAPTIAAREAKAPIAVPTGSLAGSREPQEERIVRTKSGRNFR